MSLVGARTKIEKEVLSWPGVTGHPHRFGGSEYRLMTREIGHIHGDHMVDIPLPTKLRDQVVAEGRAVPHHVLPDSGWVSLYLRQEGDIGRAIDLQRLSFEVASNQHKRRAKAPG